MGLLTGSSSFRRFRTVQSLPPDFRDTFVDGVNRYAFRENLGHRAKEPLVGWVNIFDPGDADFTLNSLLYDHYITLSMRADKKTVNARLLQILLERRYREVMNERHVDRLGKQHRAEIKEALEEELLSKALPAVNTYDVAWDINTGEVFVFATSDAVIDYVHGLLHDTFGLIIHPERMVDWLAERWDWDTIEARVDAWIPGGVAERKVPDDVDGWHTGNPLKGREYRLGAEFLTWLWHESEAHDGYFRLTEPSLAPVAAENVDEAADNGGEAAESGGKAPESAPGTTPGGSLEPVVPPPAEARGSLGTGTVDTGKDEEITLWLDNKVIFRELDDGDVPGVTTMVGESPSASPEAKLTFRSGKQPVEARVGFQRGMHQWYLTIALGPIGIELKNLKLPVEVKEGDEERVYERMYLLEVLTTTMKTLFRQFFANRTSADWPGRFEDWLGQETPPV